MANVKEFLKEWKGKNLKEMDKDDRTYFLYESLPSITNFFIRKGHARNAQDTVKDLFDRMADGDKFVKTLLRILKTNDTTPVDLGMATVIATFLERRHQDLDEELMGKYKKAIDKILATRIKELRKKTGLDEAVVRELLVVVPEPEVIGDVKYLGIYVHRVLRKLYAIARDVEEIGIEDTETVEKLFKRLFGKKMLDMVALHILLERKDIIRSANEKQMALWNLLTNFALAQVENHKKKEVVELLNVYVEHRQKDADKQRDVARRIQFASISEEDYPKIHAAYEQLSEKEKVKKFL